MKTAIATLICAALGSVFGGALGYVGAIAAVGLIHGNGQAVMAGDCGRPVGAALGAVFGAVVGWILVRRFGK